MICPSGRPVTGAWQLPDVPPGNPDYGQVKLVYSYPDDLTTPTGWTFIVERVSGLNVLSVSLSVLCLTSP